MSRIFRFKQFEVNDSGAAMKVGTDAVLLGCLAEAPLPSHILDIGTGSGVIALQLAQRFANAQITAVELEAEAAVQATLNFKNSSWHNRLQLHHADFQEWYSSTRYDLLVSNPPFYPTSFPITNSKRQYARVQGALTFDALAQRSFELSSATAWFWCILPFHLHPEMNEAMHLAGWHLRKRTDILPVNNKPANRVVAGWCREAGQFTGGSLSIRNINQAYTEEYLVLTRDFYLFA